MKASSLLAGIFVVTTLAFGQDRLPPRVVKVIGTSDIKVQPDKAVIAIGISRQNVSAIAAKKAADSAAREILSTLHSSGIEDNDIQTTFLSLEPQYDYKSGRVTYFLGEQDISVTVRDLSKLDSLLELLVKSGSNRVHSIQYETSRLREYRDQAREIAIQAAREKGDALAKALGQSIGKAYSIEEVAQSNSPYSYGLMSNVSLVEEGTRGRSGPSTAPGQRTVTASVVVCFELL